jgi:hypothetical protein
MRNEITSGAAAVFERPNATAREPSTTGGRR